MEPEKFINYIIWCKSRGLRFPVIRSSQALQLPAIKVGFICENPNTLSPECESGQLFLKMAAAMSLSHDEYTLISYSQLKSKVTAIPECQVYIILKDDPESESLDSTTEPLNYLQLITIHHPSLLIKSPELKRSAWADLQIAMKIVGKTST